MPTELEELVEFLHHGNTQIRQIAVENLVPYSKIKVSIFTVRDYAPVTDLKLLIRDYPPIAKNALTILINISAEPGVLKNLAEDEKFVDILLSRLLSPGEATADSLAMLLANLTKSPVLERLTTMQRDAVPGLSTASTSLVTQLVEIYNLGRGWNKDAEYEYLAYVFGDLAKYQAFQTYLTTPPAAPSLLKDPASPPSFDPLTSFLPHTTHKSTPRRLGTALLLRNLTLSYPDPVYLLQPGHSILPYLLLPLSSPNQDNITDEEMELLPEECQLLPPDHEQESDMDVLRAEIETVYLLAARSGKMGRKVMKEMGTYVVIREMHLIRDDEKIRHWCERIVDLLMGDDDIDHDHNAQHELPGAIVPTTSTDAAVLGSTASTSSVAKEAEEIHDDDEEDDDIVPIF